MKSDLAQCKRLGTPLSGFDFKRCAPRAYHPGIGNHPRTDVALVKTRPRLSPKGTLLTAEVLARRLRFRRRLIDTLLHRLHCMEIVGSSVSLQPSVRIGGTVGEHGERLRIGASDITR
jgi:hypothetical protein